MRAVLCLYQFGGLFFHCYCVPISRKQWLNSLTPRMASLSVSNNIPWQVPTPETCQGIVLNQWWILSTASCLIKLKYLHSEISGIINQEDILFGHRLCLHCGFAPQIGTDQVKGNIGVVFLQYPTRREEMPLSHTHDIFWKSCYNCQYKHCSIYQYQKSFNNWYTYILGPSSERFSETST
uniref:Peptidase S1 domain-containing protein n=1 Tax=Rousettus aegyptiacus TaxID=9407 RepID=A0A7J8B7A4_ROUAE|nr:hypothetical protein HJG63_010057 [Rousettus aegyptiacus]